MDVINVVQSVKCQIGLLAGYFKHSDRTWGFINGGNFWRTDLLFLTV